MSQESSEETSEDAGDQEMLQLQENDQCIVVQLPVSDPDEPGKPVFSLLLLMADGRVLMYEKATTQVSVAIRMLTELSGQADPDEWLDISSLKDVIELSDQGTADIGIPEPEKLDTFGLPTRNNSMCILEGGEELFLLEGKFLDGKYKDRTFWSVGMKLRNGRSICYNLPLISDTQARELLRLVCDALAFPAAHFTELDRMVSLNRIEMNRVWTRPGEIDFGQTIQ